MKRNDLSYELLLENLSRMQEENAALQVRFYALLVQQRSMEESLQG